jgi:AraC-like DNA-binding protein
VSNALPLSMSNVTVPAAPASRPRPTWAGARPQPLLRLAPPQPRLTPPPPPPLPVTMPERMMMARDRIRDAAIAGRRIRSYEVALDLDLSEFHFARQFRVAFGRSPHVYYDEVRAERARVFLRDGVNESEVARRVGLRRPAELRALLNKRAEPASLL